MGERNGTVASKQALILGVARHFSHIEKIATKLVCMISYVFER